MRIVVYKDALHGKRGADFAVCETLRLFVCAGHDVTLILGQSATAPLCAEIPNEVKTTFLPKPEKTLLAKLGLTHPFYRYARRLVAALDGEKSDVVLATGTNELLDLVSFGVQPEAPIVMQLHVDSRHMMKTRQKARNKKLLEAFRIPVATQVLCEAFVPMLEELVPATKGKVVAIGNACRWLEDASSDTGLLRHCVPRNDVDSCCHDAFSNDAGHPVIASEAKQSGHQSPYILYPAAFTREKNHRLLIDAFAAVAKDFPAWQLHLYGTGAKDIVDACRARVHELGLEDRILFKGFAQDLKPAYAACAFVATPSLSEGFGLIVIEAASFKKPTVALGEVPSLGSLIKDEETGRLATCESFAGALRELMADAGKCRAFGDAAFRAAQVFSPTAIQTAWCTLLRRIKDAYPTFAAGSLAVLGEGSRRRCFELPDGKFCVKFYRLESEYVARTLPSVRREIGKYRHSRTKNTCCQEYDFWLRLKESLPPDLFAVFPKRMELVHRADRGWGIIESRFRNSDGTDLKPIADELKTLDDGELARRLIAAFERLCEGLAKYAVKFYDPPNILVEWRADGSFKLRIADFEPANRVLIPLFTNTKIYIRLRVRRRARRYAKILHWIARQRNEWKC